MHPVKVGPIEIFDSIAFGTDQMVMIGDIYIKAGRVIKMVHSPDQTILLKGSDSAVDGVQGDCPQVPANLIVELISGWMISVFQEGNEDLRPLMRNSETPGFADALKIGEH